MSSGFAMLGRGEDEDDYVPADVRWTDDVSLIISDYAVRLEPFGSGLGGDFEDCCVFEVADRTTNLEVSDRIAKHIARRTMSGKKLSDLMS
ncbi:unnamed protein product [Dovyalis caffra]|uniref:Uncharacterized protein n=1 Tax=Dovyalis caffra TaxID=77055 RepID=A0AAV1RMM4_9ROSI|nr:unnamed protein product [Dovyalis caffra]